MNPQTPPQPVFILQPPAAAPPAAGRWAHWIAAFAAAVLTLVLQRYFPSLPPLPPLPIPQQPAPPVAPPADPPRQPPAAAPEKAIARIQFGAAGCTACCILPRRSDGRWDVLTASHCVSGPGARGTMRFKDGRSTVITVVATDRGADWAWAVTESADDFPALALATRSAEPGTKVWQAGYGVNLPTVRKDGTTTGVLTARGQREYRLSVSPGDSGGPILRADTNEVLSPVCCTSAFAQLASVYGAAPEAVAAGRKGLSDFRSDWIPVPVPEP